MHKSELLTPALLVDLDRMENNLEKMAQFFSVGVTRLRPHFKNHKCLALARRQLEAGAIGMTCATLKEAEFLAAAGLDSILIANEIASEDKLRRVVDLSRRAEVMVAVDDEAVALRLGSIAKDAGVTMGVLLDVNVGLDRGGVAPGPAALELARSIAASGLRFRGLMGYEGQVLRKAPGPEKVEAAQAAMRLLADTRALIEGAGMPVEIVSAGGTGSYEVSGRCPGVTEIQAGSYLLMDTDYAEVRPDFEVALTILTTVVSKTRGERIVLDAGLKSLSCERGLPRVREVEGLSTDKLNAEHGILRIDSGFEGPEAGCKIELWVHYSDATINLHDRLYGVRGDLVEEIFEISR